MEPVTLTLPPEALEQLEQRITARILASLDASTAASPLPRRRGAPPGSSRAASRGSTTSSTRAPSKPCRDGKRLLFRRDQLAAYVEGRTSMNARRDELVAALEANDHDAIKALGWWDIGEVYLTAMAPRQAGTTKDLIPLAKLLGDEDPAAVLDAIEQCAGEWRPVAGQLRAHINKARGENHRVRRFGRGRDTRHRRLRR